MAELDDYRTVATELPRFVSIEHLNRWSALEDVVGSTGFGSALKGLTAE